MPHFKVRLWAVSLSSMRTCTHFIYFLISGCATVVVAQGSIVLGIWLQCHHWRKGCGMGQKLNEQRNADRIWLLFS